MISDSIFTKSWWWCISDQVTHQWKIGGPWNKATGLCSAEAVFCTSSNWIPKHGFDVNFRFEVLKTATTMCKITNPHYGNGHGWKVTQCIFISYFDLGGYVHERTKWQDSIRLLQGGFSLPRPRFSNRVATCGTRGTMVRVFRLFLTNHRSAAVHSNLSPSMKSETGSNRRLRFHCWSCTW